MKCLSAEHFGQQSRKPWWYRERHPGQRNLLGRWQQNRSWKKVCISFTRLFRVHHTTYKSAVGSSGFKFKQVFPNNWPQCELQSGRLSKDGYGYDCVVLWRGHPQLSIEEWEVRGGRFWHELLMCSKWVVVNWEPRGWPQVAQSTRKFMPECSCSFSLFCSSH